MRRAWAILVTGCATATVVAPAASTAPTPTGAEPATEEAPIRSVSSDRDARLDALLDVHLPLSPPPVVSGALALPADWKELPLPAVLWRDAEPYPFTNLPIDDLLLTLEDRHLVVRGLRTGEPLWRSALAEETTAMLYFGAGCGVAIAFETVGISARDLESGEPRWRLDLAQPDDRTGFGDPGSARVDGCDVVVRLTPDGSALADFDAPARLLALDAASGAVRLERTCSSTCELRELDAGVAIVEEEEVLVRVPLDGSAESRVADGPCAYDRVDEGEAVAGDVCVGLTDEGIVRLDEHGAAVWSLDLGGSDPWHAPWRILALDARRALLRWGLSPIFVEVDVAAGTVTSARIAPIFGDVFLAEDVAVFAWYDETVVIDLAHEAAPIRSVESLDDDLVRTLRELDSPRPEPVLAPRHRFPVGRMAAERWLERLVPLVGDRIVECVPGLSISQLAVTLRVLGRTGSSTSGAVATAALEQTWGAAPSREVARVRIEALRLIEEPMTPEVADALVEATLPWVAWLREQGAFDAPPCPREPGCSGIHCDEPEADDPCLVTEAVLGAYFAARAALDRHAPDASFAARLRVAAAE